MPADGQPVSLTAGEMPTATGASLMSRALLRRPREGFDRVRLAGGEVLRHVGLTPSGSQGCKLTLFSLPTSRGVVGATCAFSSAAKSAAVRECLGIVKTLRTRDAEVRSLGPHAGYAATLKRLTTKLNDTRCRERTRLTRAHTRRTGAHRRCHRRCVRAGGGPGRSHPPRSPRGRRPPRHPGRPPAHAR